MCVNLAKELIKNAYKLDNCINIIGVKINFIHILAFLRLNDWFFLSKWNLVWYSALL